MTKNVDSEKNELSAEGLLALQKTVKKVERVPLHQRNRGGAPTRAGFIRRKVLGDPVRIREMLQAGWTFVANDGIVVDPLHSDKSQVGESVTRYVMNRRSTADIKHGYLMEIPKDIYEADKAAVRASRPSLDETASKEFKGQGVIGGIVQ